MKNLKAWYFELTYISNNGRRTVSWYKFLLPLNLSTQDAYDLVETIGYKKYGSNVYYNPQMKKWNSFNLAIRWRFNQTVKTTYLSYTARGTNQKSYEYHYSFTKHKLIKQ